MDSSIFNEKNTAATYHEQRLFLASGRERSFRLLGGGMYPEGNAILASKRGNTAADMA